MEKTGITRRIDELGRIVIPKEIRKNLKINSSDELEISIVDGNLVLSKFDGLETDRFIKILLNSIGKETKKHVLFTSKDKVIDGNVKNIADMTLSEYTVDVLFKRQSVAKYKDMVNLFGMDEELAYIIEPLIINGDLIGSIILYSNEEIDNKDKYIMQFSKRILENYLE